MNEKNAGNPAPAGKILDDGDTVAMQVVESNPADPLLGTVFDEKYEILGFLGSGGFARVYKARHVHLKKLVAIKFLSESGAADEEKKQRFTREARMISSISHANIVAMHDYGYKDGKPYLVMDFIEGQTLADLLKSKKQFSQEECLNIACQACDALSAAHAQGLIHRDLKPANIMLFNTSSNQIVVKLVDFGIAKAVDEHEGDSLIARTRTGEVLGTPIYMSPEQCQGFQLDGRSDIYSLGCVLYELMTGIKPFPAESPLTVMLQHINDMPRTFAQAGLRRDFPMALEAAVFKALAKKPENRFRDAAEFKAAIIAGSSGQSGAVRSVFDLLKSRSGARRIDLRLSALIIFCCICLMGIAVTFFLSRQAQWRELENRAAAQLDVDHDYEQALKTLEIALSEATAQGAPAVDKARILKRSAQYAASADQKTSTRALKYYQQSIALLENAPDKQALMDNLNALAMYQNELKKYQEALPNAQRAVQLATSLPDIGDRCYSNITLGMAYYNLHQYNQAAAAFRQAIELDTVRSKENASSARLFASWYLCLTSLAQDKPAEAGQIFETIRKDAERIVGGEKIIREWEATYRDLLSKPVSQRFIAI